MRDEWRRRMAAVLPRPNGQTARSWYDIRADAGSDTTEILLYDVIDPWWGVGAEQFVNDLNQVTTPNITLRINSPGGDVFDGWAIYQALRLHPATVTTQVDSLAASSASVVAMAGDRIVMAKPSDMMIHDPWSIMIGQASDFRAEADLLDKLANQIAGVYADRAGGTVAEWRDRMLGELWLTQDEAVDLGLAVEVLQKQSATQDRYDRSIFDLFKNTPERVQRRLDIESVDLTKRGAERILREGGFSNSRAKAILARGWDEPVEIEDEDAAALARLAAVFRGEPAAVH